MQYVLTSPIKRIKKERKGKKGKEKKKGCEEIEDECVIVITGTEVEL